MTLNELSIEQLAQQLILAKKQESDANKNRIEIEQKLIDRLGQREEGAETHELENGLRITITGKVTYQADMPLLMQICSTLPEAVRPLKTKIELDATGAKYLRNNEVEIWRQIAPAITIKPAKTSVEIKA